MLYRNAYDLPRQRTHIVLLQALIYVCLTLVAVAPLASGFGIGAASVAAVVGVVTGHSLARSRWRWPYIALLSVALLAAGLIAGRLVGGSVMMAHLLGPARTLGVIEAMTFGLITVGCILGLRTLTLRFPALAFVEAGLIVTAVAFSFRGHRNYPYSQPQVLSDWAFSQGYDPRQVLMIIGVATLAGLGFLLLPRQYLARTIVAAILILFFAWIAVPLLIISPWNPLAQRDLSEPVFRDQKTKLKPDFEKKKTPPPSLPTLTIDDARIEEGNAGTTTLSFTVTLSEASDKPVSVNFRTADGTATADEDYIPTVGMLSIPPGQKHSNLTVRVIGDTAVEADETIFVRLSNPRNAVVDRDQGRGVIINDDAEPSIALSIDDIEIREGQAGVTTGTFTLTLSAPSPRPVEVKYQVVAGTAEAERDFLPAEGTILIPPGETHAPLTVKVVGDTLVEADENFMIQLSKPIGAVLRRAHGTGVILDDDDKLPPPPKPLDKLPTIAIDDVRVKEGNSGQTAATFHVKLSQASDREVKVSYAVYGRTANAPEDFRFAEATVSFPPGATEASVPVIVLGDTKAEPDETFVVQLMNPVHATLERDSGLGTIINDDEDPTPPKLSIGDVELLEGNAGITPARFAVTLSKASTKPTDVSYGTEDGSAKGGVNFQPLKGVLKIPAGETRASLEVEVNGDLDVEADEDFRIRLANPVNATIEREVGKATIRNDDKKAAPPNLSIKDVKALEGNTGRTPFNFTVTLSAAAEREVTVEYATGGGTASPDEDYLPIKGTLRIPPGRTSETVKVEVIGDQTYEPDETFQLRLSEPRGANFDRDMATGIIANDDDRVVGETLPPDEFDWGMHGPRPLAPVLLVKLQDDYDPVERSFYLRTRAYSELLGTRMLRAEARDNDIPWSIPSEHLDLPASPARKLLRDLSSTSFLIGDHESLPGFVSMVAVEPKTNPAPAEFSAVFQLTSQVLAGPDGKSFEPYRELAQARGGNPNWDETTCRQYLAYPSDPRYRELATRISDSLSVSQRSSPLARGLAIRKWMEENVTYDYNPSHEQAADRTASFLFGDQRGYCVHLAHAMTLLLRAQDIPARVAVGYRVSPERLGRRSAFMVYASDSHAWAEIYLDGVGGW